MDGRGGSIGGHFEVRLHSLSSLHRAVIPAFDSARAGMPPLKQCMIAPTIPVARWIPL